MSPTPGGRPASRQRRGIAAAVLLLALGSCGNDPARFQPDPRAAAGAVEFRYLPPPGAPTVTSIGIAGSFNDWATGGLPMARVGDGAWRASTDLEPGRHEYKFFINGAWPADMCDDRTWGDPRHRFWIDPDADECAPDGHSGRNAVITVVDASGPRGGLGFSHDPDSAAHLSAAGGRLSIRFVASASRVHSANVVVGDETVPMHRQLGHAGREVWRAALPLATTGYGLDLETADGARRFGPFAVPPRPFTAVAWVGGAIGYQIFPERFWNGDPDNDQHALPTDAYHYLHPRHRHPPPVLMPHWGGPVLEHHCCHQYFGGDLQGVIDRLGHLETLGVTLIYLNPIFLAGSAHGYDSFDFLSVAPNFGDERTLRALLDAAAARGMRVMWDFVPNHVGVGHWAFQDAVQAGESSRYWRWFNFRVPAAQVEVGDGRHYDAWWGIGSLPKLETRNPEVLAHLLEVTRHWTEFGFRGIRVDVPNEIVNRREFFTAFRQAAKQVDPEVYLVGEIWQRSPSWLQGDEFDALMNYAIGQGVIERFVTGELGARAAAEAMGQLYAEYPEASVAMQFNLVSSHDTGRLLTKMGAGPLGAVAGSAALDRQRLAAAMLYALPGMPVTFQGDECAFLGAGEGPREENRYPLQWPACDAAMVAHYRQLAELRGAADALRSPVIRAHRAEGTALSWFRGEPGPGEALVGFNSGGEARPLPLPPGRWIDAATGEPVTGEAALSGVGWRYLLRH